MLVNGFKAAAVAAGLRYKGRLDLGLIVADKPAVAAGVFTRNLVTAAPVIWSREKVSSGQARAILVNAGQANACTGETGYSHAAASAKMVADRLGIREDEVLLASTGVIGQHINMAALEKAMPLLVDSLGPDQMDAVSQAILTTDTRAKISEYQGHIDGISFTLAGMAKGSGMICPNMATMLSFILTDAAVSPAYLQTVLARSVESSFNLITVDGDTSTNDTAIVLASGNAGNQVLESDASPGAREFEMAMNQVLAELSKMIVADGEGATKLVTIEVRGAADAGQARDAAMTVANSPLVKTAMFGEDANWGRIMGALGRSGARFDPLRVNIDVNDIPLVRNGCGVPDLSPADEVMHLAEYTVRIDLAAGESKAEVLTCDMSLDYVKINADYRS